VILLYYVLCSLSEESHSADPRDHTLPPPPPPGSPPPDVVEYHVIETAPPKTVRFMEPAGDERGETRGLQVGGAPVGVDDDGEDGDDDDEEEEEEDDEDEGEGSEEERGSSYWTSGHRSSSTTIPWDFPNN